MYNFENISRNGHNNKTCNRIKSFKIHNVLYFQIIKWHVKSKFFTIKILQTS
jgi:hypothetical protein